MPLDREELETELVRLKGERWEAIQAGQRLAADAIEREMLTIRHAIKKLNKDRKHAAQ